MDMILIDSFHWSQLLQPQFYIDLGGLWLLLFIVFAETGLFIGFFLPGDSLLFVAGIFSNQLIASVFHIDNDFLALLLLIALVSSAGILGCLTGYWFGWKSGPFLFHKKDTWYFKKKYLNQARDFYDKHGGGAIVFTRFLPIVRPFAPIVAGIVRMEWHKYAFFAITGTIGWAASMLALGHYLDSFVRERYGFDLKAHLEVIVLGIVIVTTAPVILRLVFRRSKPRDHDHSPKHD